jgi:TonB family protein
MMTENFIKHAIKVVTVVSIILMFFFVFTPDSNADENRGIDLLPEAQEVLSKAKLLNESGDKAGAKELILKFSKARMEMIPDDMNATDYKSMYLKGDIDGISKISEEMLDLIGGMDEIIKICKEEYTARPDNIIVMGSYAGALLKNRQYAEAAPLLEKVYTVSESKPPMQLLTAAHAYYLAKKPAEAKRIIDKMMELPGAPRPEWLASFYQICLTNGDFDEAGIYLESYNESARIKMLTATLSTQEQAVNQACPPDDDTDSTPIYIKDVDDPPRVTRTYIPVYPIKAVVEGIEGRVVLKFVVGREGYANEPVVVSAEPEGIFEESALDAVTEYRFIPARKDGKCVDCIVRLPVVYKLRPEPAMPGDK